MIPNWCDNDLMVEGETPILKGFQKFARGKKTTNSDERILDMNRFVPYPKKWIRQDRLIHKWRDATQKLFHEMCDDIESKAQYEIHTAEEYVDTAYKQHLLLYFDIDTINSIGFPDHQNRKEWEKTHQELIDRKKAIKEAIYNWKMSHKKYKAIHDRWLVIQQLKDGYNEGGYEWCYNNWGTKWNFCDVQEVEDDCDGYLKYNFNTAWSPPFPVILAMSKRFPTLTFTLNYFESGMGFMGAYKCKGGEVLDDFYSEEYIGGRGG